WFLTGDVGYLDEDGDLWVNDRKKDLIISGGENIYPAEIEAFIHEMADVVDGVVVGKPDNKWGEIPLAVVILKEGVTLPEVEFLKRFQDNLARYKHPKEVLFVDDLPCNAMGKVQKFEVRKMIEG
ncbi:MAG: long-chain fatty acid--CoA ligase, partial [Rhodospirillales bacterium]|nr:long-chain fatty acid--CoA ligase [Rhodospirillales bacterium]